MSCICCCTVCWEAYICRICCCNDNDNWVMDSYWTWLVRFASVARSPGHGSVAVGAIILLTGCGGLLTVQSCRWPCWAAGWGHYTCSAGYGQAFLAAPMHPIARRVNRVMCWYPCKNLKAWSCVDFRENKKKDGGSGHVLIEDFIEILQQRGTRVLKFLELLKWSHWVCIVIWLLQIWLGGGCHGSTIALSHMTSCIEHVHSSVHSVGHSKPTTLTYVGQIVSCPPILYLLLWKVV